VRRAASYAAASSSSITQHTVGTKSKRLRSRPERWMPRSKLAMRTSSSQRSEHIG
jgi:hypothetical protein